MFVILTGNLFYLRGPAYVKGSIAGHRYVFLYVKGLSPISDECCRKMFSALFDTLKNHRKLKGTISVSIKDAETDYGKTIFHTGKQAGREGARYGEKLWRILAKYFDVPV